MPINQLVQYCNAQYNRDKNGRCPNCLNDDGCESCLKCLEHIHNIDVENRTYNCPNIAYCYTCKHIYRYSSEIEHLLNVYTKCFNNVKALRICSIGCGPCSELFGIDNFRTNKSLNFRIDYKGFDFNPIWKPIHNKINDIFIFNTEFIYNDIFNFYKSDENDLPNILIINYLLSDILRTNRNNFDSFIDNLCTLYKKMPDSLLIINDINLGKRWYEFKKQVRDYYEPLIKSLQKENNIKHIGRFHFANSQRWYCLYGEKNNSNAITTKLPPETMQRYSPWTECRSVQLFILKKA